MGQWVKRYIFFMLGSILNAFGVAFITKGALGTSQISSISYVMSLQFTNVSFGTWTFLLNMIFIALQILLLKKDFKPVELLQIVANLLFSWFIDLGMLLFGFLNPVSFPARLLSLLVGCCILAFGVCIEVAPNVVMVPGEAIVRVLADKLHKPFGSMKVYFDVTLIVIATILSFVFFGRLNGVGIGTVICALLVGRLVNFFNKHLTILYKIRALAA